jgi:hypothetical protein
MTSDSSQHHDALFRRTFSVVEHAAAEFRALLPASLVERIDFSTLKLCSGNYVDEALAGSQSDLLFSVTISGKPSLLYLLFEHQSSADKLMPLRLLRYVVRILERHVQDAATPSLALPLPVVIPVVLHHSETGWTAARSLEQLFDETLVRDPQIRPLIPRLSFVLDDISRLSDEALAERALGLVPALTLWAFRDARNPARLLGSFHHWANAMAELLAAPNGREALWTIFRYISSVADYSVTDTLSQALESTKPGVKDAMTTMAERWQAEGEARGLAKGKAEGKAELLRKLLTLKFGELSDDAQQRLARASEIQLDRLTERLLAADTLDAVLSEA